MGAGWQVVACLVVVMHGKSGLGSGRLKKKGETMVYEKKYSWRFNKSVSAQVAGEVMERIEKRDGELTKEAFLEESRPEDSPTHGLFEWDDTAAAEKFRLAQSRICIQDIVVTIVKNTETPKTVHAFVNTNSAIGRKEKASYSNIEVALSDEDKRKVVLRNAFYELQIFEQKYSDYQELAGVFAELHKAERIFGGIEAVPIRSEN